MYVKRAGSYDESTYEPDTSTYCWMRAAVLDTGGYMIKRADDGEWVAMLYPSTSVDEDDY